MSPEINVEVYSENITWGNAIEWLPPVAIIAVISLILALYGFRLLRPAVAIEGAAVGFLFGYNNLALLVGDAVSGDWLPITLGIAVAVIGALIAYKVYKIVLFLDVALGTYLYGYELFSEMFREVTELPVSTEFLVQTVSLVCAIVIAFVVYKLFKPIYIVSSAITGMALLAVAVVIPLETVGGAVAETAATIAVYVGLVLAIPAAIKQFKSCKGISF